MSFATPNYERQRTNDSIKVVFKKPVSSTDIAALKANIESNYRVAFNYTGLEFDYIVTLEGSDGVFQRAMNTLFPKGRDDLFIQRSSSVG